MKVLFVAATTFEIGPFQEFLKAYFIPFGENIYQRGDHSCEILVSGVGLPSTIFQLSQKLFQKEYDLIINAGIAGAFNRQIKLGSVLQVTEDQFGDLGIEEADGSFQDLFDMELMAPNGFPFQKGKLINTNGAGFDFLPKATALTVQKVSGSAASIAKIQEKYTVDLESMEGAGVFYVAQQCKVPILQIRAVSNYVEARNRDAWEIQLAIEKLNEVLIELVQTIF